jgi:hypothetical protein
MNEPSAAPRGLSQQDAFFVAYQEESAVAMQLGAELEVAGALERGDLERCLAELVRRWPQLGQTVRRRVLGLAWDGPVRLGAMLAEGCALEQWRNTPIDPFREPPFQLLWVPAADPGRPEERRGTLAFRAHHAALDGQALATVCDQALRLLAAPDRAGPPAAAGPAPRAGRLGHRRHLGSMWRYLRWLRREARQGRSARLAVRVTAPGDIAVCSLRLAPAQEERLRERAREAGVELPWLCSAAWVRALGGWNAARGGTNPLISLELPVSIRPGRGRAAATVAAELGNGISPLLLFADATRPLAELARDLRRQLATGVRRRAHLAVPTFTAAGRYLPWWLFRRLACDAAYSGFATSHFTWMRSPIDAAEVARLSGGRLAVLDQRLYGPVCLHMGAALQGLETAAGLRLSITHRLNALPAEDAGALADRLLAELGTGGSP